MKSKRVLYLILGGFLLLTGCKERPRTIGDLIKEDITSTVHTYEVVYGDNKTVTIKANKAVFDSEHKSIWFYNESGEIKEVYYEVESAKEID